MLKEASRGTMCHRNEDVSEDMCREEFCDKRYQGEKFLYFWSVPVAFTIIKLWL